MRYTGPRTKKARRLREPLRDKDVKYIQKRGYPPGQHGQARQRISEYGTQLLAKQKAKWIYGVTEKQFRRYYEDAERNPETTPEVLLALLELRLDNVVYRLGFGETRPQARQMVSHRFITVNGKRVNIPSYQVRVGDEIAIASGKKESKMAQTMTARIKEYKPLEWLRLSAKDLSGKVLSRPTVQNTASTIQMQLISEHYSR